MNPVKRAEPRVKTGNTTAERKTTKNVNKKLKLTSGMESFWSSPISTLSVTAMLNERIPTNTATLETTKHTLHPGERADYKNTSYASVVQLCQTDCKVSK